MLKIVIFSFVCRAMETKTNEKNSNGSCIKHYSCKLYYYPLEIILLFT